MEGETMTEYKVWVSVCKEHEFILSTGSLLTAVSGFKHLCDVRDCDNNAMMRGFTTVIIDKRLQKVSR